MTFEPQSITGTSGVWTRAMVYKNPSLSFLSLPPGNTTARFTPEFLTELNRETRWSPVQDRPRFPEELSEAVGTGAAPCPLCNDNGSFRLLHRGETTGLPMYRLVRCGCRYPRLFWLAWKDVPDRFRDVRLSTLVPRGERQGSILADLRARPEDSYLLCGPPGTGKTHFATALYREAVSRNAVERFRNINAPVAVWRMDATLMLQEHQDWDFREKADPNCTVACPTVRLNAINNAARGGYRPCLYLDEIDKLKPSDYRLNRMRELVNCVYEAQGQVVATMNLTPKALTKKWRAELGDDMGDAFSGTILRRIAGEDTNGHLIQF